MYSRASILLLDDVLSAGKFCAMPDSILTNRVTVDAHTARHLYNECIKGDLAKGRTIILVSHHVQLCVSGASYVVALDNGHVTFAGEPSAFKGSEVMTSLIQSDSAAVSETEEPPQERRIEALSPEQKPEASSPETSTTSGEDVAAREDINNDSPESEKKSPRKLVGEEKRAVGRIGREIWKTYFWACGGKLYWMLFVFAFTMNGMGPVFEKGWLRYEMRLWSNLT